MIEDSGIGQISDDVLSFEVPDEALERAASARPGGAMSFPSAPTVSVLFVCCSQDDGGGR